MRGCRLADDCVATAETSMLDDVSKQVHHMSQSETLLHQLCIRCAAGVSRARQVE